MLVFGTWSIGSVCLCAHWIGRKRCETASMGAERHEALDHRPGLALELERLLIGTVDSPCVADQIGKAAGAHLAHDLSSPDLDSYFA